MTKIWVAAFIFMALFFAGALQARPENSGCADQMTETRTLGYIDGMRETTNLFKASK